MKEKKLRIEDALAATRAAVEEGIVPGGGVALLSTVAGAEAAGRDAGRRRKDGRTDHPQGHRGAYPPDREERGSGRLRHRRQDRRAKNPAYGFDALKNEYTDMVESGIIDPTKVTRSALQNAASVAATLLTTESVVTDIPAPEPAAPAGGGMGGGMY